MTQNLADASLDLNHAHLDFALQKVGMAKVDVAIRRAGQSYPAEADIYVNLKSGERGIHMSRLYELLTNSLAQTELTPACLRTLAKEVLECQSGLSEQCEMTVRFDLLEARPALETKASGFRVYPAHVSLQGNQKQFKIFWGLDLLYSSTCPNSLALSRQIIDESKGETWATPHAQRSRARIRGQLVEADTFFKFQDLIEQAERALATPVQTFVKRRDEAQFAKLNAAHPKFCEDAARILAAALQKQKLFQSFHVRVEHFESLHAHDAIAEIIVG